MVHPTPNRLVRHRHSAFRQQIFDVAQAEGEPEVKPYRLLNDLGRETIPAVADLVHSRGATRPLRTPQARIAVTMPLTGLDKNDPQLVPIGLATGSQSNLMFTSADMLKAVGGDHKRVIPVHEDRLKSVFPSRATSAGLHVVELALADGETSLVA